MTEVKKETDKKLSKGGSSYRAKPTRIAMTDPSFKGGIKELEGFYFDFMPDALNGERFEKSLEAMVNFVGRGGGGDFKNGNLIARALEDMTPVTLAQP
mmetsp:Transcript_37417/g.52794  ORF Transcript_37417/g.52794 Transcript_37417/m.52794 type:complete len:98 (-) Transcript_37417:152-445(-)|eukprot:CAMPEP_0202450382 /NCGR_PEP_ID=MMETSP1360-20130828/8998_1 /ASSEMBLY_ACC=CAM_ASM_000848 /TAXON_ID=515479 /ORGANISM="Licmophora paradoxa, Strain CCMP2313" /LENGTH=97 /DNA_ID=CAMNT_0049068619 /DNA_START=36 /DNA_END=329 /DNA_ORIENTATION=+